MSDVSTLVHWWTRYPQSTGIGNWVSCHRIREYRWLSRGAMEVLTLVTDEAVTCLACMDDFTRYYRNEPGYVWVRSRD